jgi:hypothetical protein
MAGHLTLLQADQIAAVAPSADLVAWGQARIVVFVGRPGSCAAGADAGRGARADPAEAGVPHGAEHASGITADPPWLAVRRRQIAVLGCCEPGQLLKVVHVAEGAVPASAGCRRGQAASCLPVDLGADSPGAMSGLAYLAAGPSGRAPARRPSPVGTCEVGRYWLSPSRGGCASGGGLRCWLAGAGQCGALVPLMGGRAQCQDRFPLGTSIICG